MIVQVINKKDFPTIEADYVGRGSVLGNIYDFRDSSHPQVQHVVSSRGEAVKQYKIYLEKSIENGEPDICNELNRLIIKYLKGESVLLSCYCKPAPCHGDIIEEVIKTSKYCINWFSNMRYLFAPLVHQGISYRSVENFYQAMKAPRENLEERRKVADMTPFASKKYGRKMQVRPDWEEVKEGVMEVAIKHKFTRDPHWKSQLEKCNTPTVEWNNWGDTFWGVDIFTGEGENRLGEMVWSLKK